MYKIGDKVCNFVCTDIIECNEIGGLLYEFKHIKNDCPLYWMKTDDDNKLFSVGFRTIPEDSTGVFHILEHSVLNGSEKYPVKEPFVDLLKSSMNTFLNAMTYGEKTLFPVASRNQKDLNNLMSVYLDAVFKPKIYENPNIFYQEGWHIELNDKDSEPIYKGVVYNEMKGALSSVDAQLEWNLYNTMFEGSCYGFESGGIPKNIPDLTYEKFVETHKKYYHPTNAIFYLDGDIDFEGAVNMISEYVDSYEKGEKFEVPTVNTKKGIKKVVEYDFSEDDGNPEENSYLIMGKQFGSYKDQKPLDFVTVLSSYLTGSNISPLKDAVVSKGLATDVTASMEASILQPVFTLKFDNIKPGDVEEIKKTVAETIAGLLKDGLDKEELSASINSYEFAVYEDVAFKGMANMTPVVNTVMFGADLRNTFDFKSSFDYAREALNNGTAEKLLRELFDMEDYIEILANPSKTISDEEAEDEKNRVNACIAAMDDKSVEALIDLNNNLAVWQASIDNPAEKAKLPKLSLSDVNPYPKKYDGFNTFGNKTFYKIDRKGTYYINLYFDVNVNDIKSLSLLSLGIRLFMNLSTEKYEIKELKRLLKNYVGNIKIAIRAINKAGESDECRIQLVFSMAVLSKYLNEAKDLLKEIILKTDFSDKKEIKKLLKQTIEAQKQFISQQGHSVAIMRAAASENAVSSANEAIKGYTRYSYLKEICENFDEKADDIISRIKNIFAETFTKERLTIGVTGADMPELSDIFEILPNGDICTGVRFEKAAKGTVGIVVPAGIAFAGKAVNYFELGEKYMGSMRIIANILTLGHLWNEIRVKGGAYGAGLRIRANGMIFYYSYRDPSPAKSVATFNESGKALSEFIKDKENLEEFIISSIAECEPLETSAETGEALEVNYFLGIDYDERSKRYREILNCNYDDLEKLSKLLDESSSHGNICVVGGKNLVDSLKPDIIVNL